MHYGAPPHSARCMKELPRRQFGDERINSRQFPTTWPPRSPDLNPSIFGFEDSSSYLYPTLKKSIERRVRNIPQLMLLSIVEHAILCFQMVADNNGHHNDHVL